MDDKKSDFITLVKKKTAFLGNINASSLLISKSLDLSTTHNFQSGLRTSHWIFKTIYYILYNFLI